MSHCIFNSKITLHNSILRGLPCHIVYSTLRSPRITSSFVVYHVTLYIQHSKITLHNSIFVVYHVTLYIKHCKITPHNSILRGLPCHIVYSTLRSPCITPYCVVYHVTLYVQHCKITPHNSILRGLPCHIVYSTLRSPCITPSLWSTMSHCIFNTLRSPCITPYCVVYHVTLYIQR